MRNLILFGLLSFTIFSSCKKDAPIPAKQKTVCGTVGWPQGNWKVKFFVSGITKPDSVNFNINGGQAQFGTLYYKTFIKPSVVLADSIYFCGDKNSDIIINLYDNDTTHTYITKIYVNDSLIIQKIGYKQIFTVGQCK